MRRIGWACGLALSLSVTACVPEVGRATREVADRAASPEVRSTAVVAHALGYSPHGLRQNVAGYLAGRPGRAAVMVEDLRTGASFGWSQHSSFMTASIVKVDILAGLLLLRQDQHLGLSDNEQEAAARMIHFSDNKAANTLYREVGMGAGLTLLNRRLGLRETFPYSTSWGSSDTTPADQIRLLHQLTDDSSPLRQAARRYVLRLMSGVTPEQAWGISAAAEDGEMVALKNGWVPLRYQGIGWEINSIGRIIGRSHDFLVAVMTTGNPSRDAGIETTEHLADLVVSALRHAR